MAAIEEKGRWVSDRNGADRLNPAYEQLRRVLADLARLAPSPRTINQLDADSEGAPDDGSQDPILRVLS